METSLNPRSKREAGPYSGHVASLDGLRGMAVLAVMASHLFPGGGEGRLMDVAHATLGFGATGVDLFFVLSGFLITGILYDSLSDDGYFRKFYARRALRIFPLYYGVLFVMLALTPLLGLAWQGMQWVLLFYLQNTDVAGPFYAFKPGAGLNLDHFWSLAVEEQFYLVWPLVVFLVRGRKKLLWVCAAFFFGALLLRFYLTFHHVIYHTVNRNTFCRVDSLLTGAAMALLLRGRMHDVVLNRARRVFWAVVAIVVSLNVAGVFVARHPEHVFAFDASYLSLRYTFMALGSAALIAWCLRPGSTPRRIFEGRTLRFFGKYSYGLYVLHLVALRPMIDLFRGWVSLVTPSKGISVVVAGVLSFGVSVVAAYVSYNFYEKPFLKLKHYFDYTGTEAVQRKPPVDLSAA